MAATNVMTEAGMKKLQEQLDYLIGTRRNEIAKQIEFARGFGDLSENAEYDEAKREQGKVEEEISRLQNLLRTATVVSEEDINTERVSVGTVVTVIDQETQDEETFTIVGSEEADPWKDLISNESAIGKALVGKSVGDQVEVDLPAATITYQIVSISGRN